MLDKKGLIFPGGVLLLLALVVGVDVDVFVILCMLFLILCSILVDTK